MYGSHPPSHKGKHQKVTLAYCLLVAAPATVTNQSNPKTWEWVILTQHYMFARRFLLHRTITTQGYSLPNDKPRSVHYYDVSTRDRLTTTITLFLLRAYASYTYEETHIEVTQSKEKTWFISPFDVECTIAMMESRHGLQNSTMASPCRTNHGG
jgi:hypothetical protein